MNELKFYKNLPENGATKEGRFSRVEVLEEVKISEGGFGDIYSVVVSVGDKRISMIIKKFKDGVVNSLPGEIDNKKTRAKHAFEVHEALKKEGLKVFPTYRIGEDGESILMTNGDESGYVCIGNNYHSPTLESRGYKKINEIKNFEQLVDSVLSEIKKATERQILLPKDSYMFLINIENNEAKFVIGDLDLVEQSSRFEHDFLLAKNIEYAISALNGFIEQSVTIPKQNEYFRYLDKLKKEILTD